MREGERGTEDHTEAPREGVGGAHQIYKGNFFWVMYTGELLAWEFLRQSVTGVV